MNNILEVENLKAYYLLKTVSGVIAAKVHAVDGVSLTIKSGEIVGIAGESGCGKSTLAKAMYGWIAPPLQIFEGSVFYDVGDKKINILKADEEGLRRIWWNIVSYIPQGSMDVLNPTMRIKDHFFNVIKFHSENFDKEEAEKTVLKHLDELGLPREVLTSFPHQLSGGMKQRVVIALATILGCNVIIADEPTTALDVMVQRGILQLLTDIQKKLNCSIILITHDMGVHAQITDRIAIMYAGKIVEMGPTDRIFEDPQQPYTKFLISSLPRIGDKSKKTSIGGRPPSLIKPPKGCRFHPRCPLATEICREVEPPLVKVNHEHYASCHLLR